MLLMLSVIANSTLVYSLLSATRVRVKSHTSSCKAVLNATVSMAAC